MKRIMLSSSTSFLAGHLGVAWDTALLPYKWFLYTGMEIHRESSHFQPISAACLTQLRPTPGALGKWRYIIHPSAISDHD